MFYILVCLILLAVFGYSGCKIILAYIDWKRSARWPKARGTVVHFKTTMNPEAGFDRLDVLYNYTVNSVTYTSTRISPGSLSYSPREIARLREKYPEGGDVEVIYDPDSPEVAYLESGSFDRWNYIWLVFGCIIIMLTLRYIMKAFH